jgi:calcium-binding protein CML
VDGNGTVEFAEFVILMTNKVKEMSKEEEIMEAFNIIDKEKDSLISVKELKYFMRKVAHVKLSSEEAEAMIEFADSDEDGFVTYDDFLQVISLASGGGGGNELIEEEEDSEAESEGFR